MSYFVRGSNIIRYTLRIKCNHNQLSEISLILFSRYCLLLSRYCIICHHNFGEDARKAMPCFAIEFECDPSKPHYGFKSWDDFFTRKFRKGIRPIAAPSDDRVIVNACESAPYKVQRNVKLRDRFWIKSQPYSLEHMLATTSLFTNLSEEPSTRPSSVH